MDSKIGTKGRTAFINVKAIIENEKTAGILLIICTVFSLVLANSSFQEPYLHFWHQKIGILAIEEWINDGLMTIFFLLVGMELEREIYFGELSTFRKASLPIVAAIGGMAVPAIIFYLINYGLPTQSGTGIPMATDIAFAVGILSLLGKNVPTSLKILLTALAVIDDIGAILVIAIFYSKSLSLDNLLISGGILGGLFLLNALKVKNFSVYAIGGAIMWFFMLSSGVHATITGVLLAFAIPNNTILGKSQSIRLEKVIHYPVIYLILPLFALANTGIIIENGWFLGLTEKNSLGIIAGLTLGKPLGIFLFATVSIAIGMCKLPNHLKFSHIFGVGLLGGIGFTMSIFITLLAHDSQTLISHSKIAILVASLTSAVMGFLWLGWVLKKGIKNQSK